jgi:hypothetical protein
MNQTNLRDSLPLCLVHLPHFLQQFLDKSSCLDRNDEPLDSCEHNRELDPDFCEIIED